MGNAGSRTQELIEKALQPHNGGEWLAMQLHHHGVDRDGANKAAALFTTRSGTAPEAMQGFIEKAYLKPIPKPQALSGASLQIHMALSIAEKTFAEDDFLISPFLHRGLIVLGGPAKIGKTVFVHQLARSVITGKDFSAYECNASGKVLWLNLEEREKDVQGKLRCVWNMADEKERELMNSLHIVHDLPKRITDGGEALIREALSKEKYSMLVVDSLTAASRRSNGRGDLYGEDYDRIEALKKICHESNIAGVLIHHTNKRSAEDEDAINLLAGTGGLAAASDSVLVLVRTKGQKVLKFRSRCIEQDDLQMVMDWDNGGWHVEGRAVDATTQQRAQIVSALEANGPCTPKELAERVGKAADAVHKLLARMLEKGTVTKCGEGKNTKYAAVPRFGRKPGEPFVTDTIPI